MDWEKWRKEEDERQQDIQAAKKLMDAWGIGKRSRLQLIIDRISLGVLLIVAIPFILVGSVWVFDLYQADPSLWPMVRGNLKAIGGIVVLFFAVVIAFMLIFLRKSK